MRKRENERERDRVQGLSATQACNSTQSENWYISICIDIKLVYRPRGVGKGFEIGGRRI